VQKDEHLSEPKVIGHRGACGYRPENTLESFALAFAQGVETIEFDLILTKDAALIIRHENSLALTTDIGARPEFAQMRRWGQIEGDAGQVQSVEGWFSEDLTLAQVKSLRAIERMPVRRPKSAEFDGQFMVPTFEELLASSMIDGKTLIVEIKDGTHIDAVGKNVGELVSGAIAASGALNRGVKFVIESFAIDLLRQARVALTALDLDAQYFLPVEGDSISDEELAAIANEFDGIAVSMFMLRESPQVVQKAKALSLPIYVFTARVEFAKDSIAKYFDAIIDADVDGVFADQPDLLLQHLANREASSAKS
jgi:glycerophosphoryl diester phosphodiesterase